GGYATYFLQNGNPGHCGTVAQESDKVIALPTPFSPSRAELTLSIGQTPTEPTLGSFLQDSCPTCVNNESLDLSQGAFTAIA
ncbi:hypothetical protein BCR35DRAFT_259114, partial [Leucosporidium creatinivorum]